MLGERIDADPVFSNTSLIADETITSSAGIVVITDTDAAVTPTPRRSYK